MKNQKGEVSKKAIVFIVILLILLVIAFNIYKKNFFSGFIKGVTNDNCTKFSRDSKIKYSEDSSYKIENYEYNDATFYKEVEVEPNTPYRITCMVKTQDIECKDQEKLGGVTIGLMDIRDNVEYVDSAKYSIPIKGTNDWQQIEYIFNSKNTTKAKVSFRLGGNQNECKGIVWFADMKLEKGIKNKDSEWNAICFFMNEVDVTIEGKNYHFKLNDEDKENAKLNLARYANDCYNFSNKKMTVNYETMEIYEPITTASWDDEHGWHFAPEDVSKIIYETVKENKYDHIFIVCRMENEDGSVSIPIKDNWIGLGSMDMYNIGFSLIRINSRANQYTYKYGITNQAPEEVYLHEFLHTLERNCIEAGYEIPALHDYEKYGYTEQHIDGLNDWYEDYMQAEIFDEKTKKYIGLNEYAYKTQPFNTDNFRYPVEQDLYYEPQNLFEEIQTAFKVLTKQI